MRDIRPDSVRWRDRLSALFLLLAALFAAYFTLVLPLMHRWQTDGRRIAAAQRVIKDTESIQSAAQKLQSAEATWQAFSTSSAAGLLHGPTQRLQKDAADRIDSLFASLGGGMTSAKPLEIQQKGLIDMMTLQVMGRLPEAQLGPFLSAIESSTSSLIISDFESRRGEGENIKLTFDVLLFRLKEEGV